MLPPVRITHAELIGCIGRITQRHRSAACCNPADVPSPARANPRETLSYLRKHPILEGADWLSRADALDAQLLVIACAWERWRAEEYHLRAGLSDGLFYSQLGDVLGIGRSSDARSENDPRPARRRRTGRGDPQQPARHRLATLTKLLRYDEPACSLTRSARRAVVLDSDDSRKDWLADHRDELMEVAHGLSAAADRHGVVTRLWLDELLTDATDASFTPATLAILGLAAAEIRTARPVASLTSTHKVHRVLLAADSLRCRFSGLDCHAHWQSAPPPADVAELTQSILRRRTNMDDQRRDRLPAPDGADPTDVLRFLRRAPAANRAVRAFDHLDALGLLNAIWWRDRTYELWAFQAGLRSGVLRTQLGSAHAITNGQGVQDRIDRLTALKTRGKPDEKQARDSRHSDRAKIRRQAGWIDSNQRDFARLASALLAAATELSVAANERDWLDLLSAEQQDGDFTATSLATIAFAADELQAALDEADAAHPEIDMLLEEIDALPTVKRLRAATKPTDYGDLT